jgi:hypothetical protein
MSQGANKAGGVIGSPYTLGAGLSGTSYGQISIDSLNSRHEFDDGLDIRLTPAAGGFVVSIFHRNSGNRPSLHLITEDQDLGAELGKIITVSYLKKA